MKKIEWGNMGTFHATAYHHLDGFEYVEDIDLTLPTEDAINSLKIVFACDESVKTGRIVQL